MTRMIYAITIGIFFIIFNGLPAWAEKRVALVIGNSNYAHVPTLSNPRNDAADVSAALRRLKFDVIEGINLDKAGMDAIIRKYAKAIEGAQVALFYYAGHGLQVNGTNFLAPVDAELKSEADLDFDMTPLSLILRQMERSKRTNLVFLDACRDNPILKNLSRSMPSTRSANLTRGLARVETGVGTMISYATEPGNVALDGNGRNSPFTKALLANIETKGVSINDMMINVRKQVLTETDGKQVPWENSSLTGRFYFKPGNVKTASLSPVKTRAPEVRKQVMMVDDSALEHTFWISIKDTNDQNQFQAYLDRFPNGIFADLAKVKIASLSKSRTILVEQKPKTKASTPQNTQLALANTAELQPSVQPRITAPTLDPEQIAWQMQTELKRVGCYLSSIDGDWGPGSIRAWINFKRHARMRNLPAQPDANMIALLKDFKSRVCPPTYRRNPNRNHARNRAPRHRGEHRAPPRRQNGPDAGTSALIGGLIGLGIGLSVRRHH